MGLSITRILRVSTNLHRIATVCLNDLALTIQSLHIYRLLERLLSVFEFINYKDFKGIYKSTQNSDYMFERPNYDHMNSSNLQAFGAAMQIFWVYQLPGF